MRHETGYILVRDLPDGTTEVYRQSVRADDHYAPAIQMFNSAEEAENAAVRYYRLTANSVWIRSAATERGWHAVEVKVVIHEK